jgi:Raf kinase inhibitor-like YbhB/YbcL family protein
MRLWSNDFKVASAIPAEFAFGKPDAGQHMALSTNRSPSLSWADVPAGAKSLVLLCHDPDVPTRADDVNQEDRRVPADLPRMSFFHWVLVDLPPTASGLDAGFGSEGITPRGKSGPAAPLGARHGLNDYTLWFAGDEQMSGEYYGYDGPCPPWNDTVMHHYHFTLYALDVARCAVDGRFTGHNVRAAMADHVLAQAEWMGTYTIAMDVR